MRRPGRICLLVVVLYLLLVEASMAQFGRLTYDDGLSQNTVQTILQDRVGFMWFGTYDGLNLYDGYTFRVFRNDPEDSNSLSDNFIWSLAEDKQGAIWIATNTGGLNRFDPVTETFTRFSRQQDALQTLCSDHLYDVYADPEGGIWVGTQFDGLCYLDPDRNLHLQYRYEENRPDGLSDNTVNDILRTRSGTLWVATGNGLNQLDPQREGFITFNHDPNDGESLSDNTIQVLFEDSVRRLWIGTNRGLCYRDPSSRRFRRYEVRNSRFNGLNNAQVTGIVERKPGVLWIATNGAGLFRLVPESDEIWHFEHDPSRLHSLGTDDLLSLAVDHSNVLWIGTGGASVSKFTSSVQQFRRYQRNSNDSATLPADIVRGFAETKEGTIWVGHASGISRLDQKTGSFTHYLPDPGNPNSLAGSYVRALSADTEGRLWIGMNGAGLDRFDPRTGVFQHFHQGAGGLTSDEVLSVLADREGRIWVGTKEGLNRLDPKSGMITAYRYDPDDPFSLSNNYVQVLYQDRSGDLWVGTRNGLNCLDPGSGSFTRYRHESSLPGSLSHDYVTAIFESKDGTLWVGTNGGGLNRLVRDNDTFDRWTVKDGLPNNIIYGIQEDNERNLWLSTNNGLVRFRPDDRVFTRFGVKDGLTANEFNTGAHYRSSTGTLYFGGIDGFVAFKPDQINRDVHIPPVVLTRFEVLGKTKELPQSIRATERIRLRYDENFFAFEFAALDFTSPSQNRYRYRLKGYDRDWIDAGNRRLAIYTGVPPGEYTLSVRGANSNGVWNEESTSIRIQITPPFWRTWWFRLIGLALLVGVAISAYRYRVHHLIELERTRSRIANDLHDDIGSKMSSIALSIEMASLSSGLPGSEKQCLENAARNTRRLVDDLRDTVWIIDSSKEGLVHLVARLEQVAFQMLESVSHRIHVPEHLPDLELEMAVRRHILLIFKEALHNAIRHAQATLVEVRIAIEGRFLVIEVKDNGIGFEPEKVRAGYGLESMHGRARSLGGRLRIESQPQQGTCVMLELRLPGLK